MIRKYMFVFMSVLGSGLTLANPENLATSTHLKVNEPIGLNGVSQYPSTYLIDGVNNPFAEAEAVAKAENRCEVRVHSKFDLGRTRIGGLWILPGNYEILIWRRFAKNHRPVVKESSGHLFAEERQTSRFKFFSFSPADEGPLRQFGRVREMSFFTNVKLIASSVRNGQRVGTDPVWATVELVCYNNLAHTQVSAEESKFLSRANFEASVGEVLKLSTQNHKDLGLDN